MDAAFVAIYIVITILLCSLLTVETALVRQNETGSSGGPSVQHPVSTIKPFAPLSAMKDYVCAFHIYSDNAQRQVQAHHYCSAAGSVHQCVIFTNNTANAKLVGIEYLIPAEVYQTLPAEEQQLWHSHIYEVKSGMLQSPGMPNLVTAPLISAITNMYGKTFHTWQVDKGHTIPLGAPQLMMSFTADGQLQPQLKQQFEQQLNFSMKQSAAARANITPSPARPLANADFPWHSGGKAWQTKMGLVPFVGVRNGSSGGDSSAAGSSAATASQAVQP